MWEDDDEYYAQDFLTFTPDIPHEMVYPSGAATVLPDGSVRNAPRAAHELPLTLTPTLPLARTLPLSPTLILAPALGLTLSPTSPDPSPNPVPDPDPSPRPRPAQVPFAQRMSVAQHFALVHHQLAQIRDALALAQALGRILVLPRLVCGLDRYWAPHAGIIPGSATQLPLLECPADHVIDLEHLHGRRPEALLREHTMLCNPRMKREVLESTRDVTRAQLRSATAEEARTAHAAVKILHVDGPLPTWRETLEAGPHRKAFKDVIRHYGSLWCCNMPPGGRGPGHIWYDFLADVVPHTDRHDRKWTTAWKPIMGP
jgi:hypothetical protein